MPMLKRVLFATFLGVLFLSFNPLTTKAQTFRAQITGTVTDPTGAIVPSVKITATNVATNTVQSAESNAQGDYRILDLLPGQYKVQAEASGFKTFLQGPIALQVADIVTVNIKLELGAVSQQVQVTGAPPLLETQSATLGQVITGRSIVGLPLNVRDPLALLGLSSNVVFGSNFGQGNGQSADRGRNFFESDFNAGGGLSGSQEIMIDGAPDTTGDTNRGVIDPPVDSVQEFKVQTNSYSAEYGRTTGGVINIITKSGTNDYHGRVYDFERNSVLDANSFFGNRAGLKKSTFIRHQFGFDAGGPIIKDRFFAFGDFEGLRQGFPLTLVSTVPTALQRQGDFSQTFAANGQLITIYDPSTLTTLQNGSRVREPFSGNIIPSINPVAQNVLSFVPLPNSPGNAVTHQNNYTFGTIATTNTNKYDIRLDANFSDKLTAFGRASHQSDARATPGPFVLPGGGGRVINDKYDQDMIDFSYAMSPQTVAGFRFSFTRALASQLGLSNGFDMSKLGMASNFTGLAAPQFPGFTVSDSFSAGVNAVIQNQPRNTFAWQGNITHIIGPHTLKFGTDIRILDFNEGQNGTPSGVFDFSRLFTQGPNPVQSSANAGYGLATFLLGDVTGGSIQLIQPISTRGLYYGFYVQDDWRVSHRLTLNLGIRYDTESGDKEKYGRLAWFNPDAPNPQGPIVGLPNLTGMLGWLGGGISNQLQTDNNNFGPRFGFAYLVDQKTVVRGGYGVYYQPRIVRGLGGGAIEAFSTTNVVGTVDGVTPATSISNPFPTGFLFPANDKNPLADEGSSISLPLRQYRTGYVQLWNIEIQRNLPKNILLSLDYNGNKGTKLITGSWNLNQLPDRYLSLGQQLNSLVPNPFYGIITQGALSGPSISLRQSLLPFPNYTGISQVNVPAGTDIYHAFSVRVEKRVSTGLAFLASYTWSKAIDNIGGVLDMENRQVERGLSGFDVPHRLVFSWTYELPFGKGREFGTSWNPVLNQVLGNWNFNGIMTLSQGQPISVSRPSVNDGKNASLSSPTIDRWFNTSVFSPAAPFTFGNVGPVLSDVRSDGIKNFDLVLVKNFPFSIHDHPGQVEFRSEFFNAFNHPLFAAPNGSVTSPSFGAVSNVNNTPRDIQFGLKIIF